MYKLKTDEKQLVQLDSSTFKSLGLKERFDLQEWIRNNPEVLGEPLLIIQKEFNGFKETKERLDLLAIDKNGNLVIIENKTDESGKDVVWQALKYAAYCHALQNDEIISIYNEYLIKHGLDERINASKSLINFLEIKDLSKLTLNRERTQRIILVSREFSHEVKATSFWLLNYSIDIKCIKVNIFKDSDNVYVSFDQFLPAKETENFITQLRNKSIVDKISMDNERNNLRLSFWSELLQSINSKIEIFKTISPLKENWLYKTTGINGIGYVFKITQTSATVRVDISGSGSTKEWCNKSYNEFLKRKKVIEEKFGGVLIWDNPDEIKGATISCPHIDFNLYDQDEWTKVIDFLSINMTKLYNSVKDYIPEIKGVLKNE